MDHEVDSEEGSDEEVQDSNGRAEEETQEGEEFDITLPTTHSYMGGLNPVSGRTVLEAGWRGRLPAIPQSGPVFPGETVPLRLTDPNDIDLMRDVVDNNKLFAVLFGDTSEEWESGVGAVCEVYEAGREAALLSLKARVIARARTTATSPRTEMFAYVTMVEVEVLPEYCLRAPLRHARLASLDPWRDTRSPAVEAQVSRLDAAVTAWPGFVFHCGDYAKLRERAYQYFAPFTKIHPPEEPVALSYWVCRNVWARGADRLRLLREHDAAARTNLALSIQAARGSVQCGRCGAAVARLQHAFAMSAAGLRANYTNIGGYVHDVVTVSHARGGRCAGAASAEFSWFPGYSWTVLVCQHCDSHLGWRFDALKSNLRPKRFYGLSRGSIQPRLAAEHADSDDAEM